MPPITPPAPPDEPTLPELEILDSAGAVLYSAPFFQERDGTYGLNRQTMQADGSDLQNVSGDGRTVIGEHTFFIRVEGVIRVERRKILDALRSAATLRYYDVAKGFTGFPVTQDIAGGIRIASETPIGRGDEAWKFGLVIAPSTEVSTDGVFEGVGLV